MASCKLDDDNVGKNYYDYDMMIMMMMQLVQFNPQGGKAIVNGYTAFNYYDNPTINYRDMTYGPTGLLSLYCI